MQLRSFDGVGGKRDQYQIDPRTLRVRPDFNIRDLTTPAAREKLDILKAQILDQGVLEALEIEFDGVTPWINEGHRRHMAVMELIAEGHDFKTVPCIQEMQGGNPGKRQLHMLMRKKEDYEPLEYAKGIHRLVNVYGWDKAKLATALGFKSKASIEQHLEMLAMSEQVKEHVRNGEVSATLARQISKNADPKFAAELIAANLAENKKIKGAGRSTKVTAKTIARDKKSKGGGPNVVGGPKTASAAEPVPVSDAARPHDTGGQDAAQSQNTMEVPPHPLSDAMDHSSRGLPATPVDGVETEGRAAQRDAEHVREAAAGGEKQLYIINEIMSRVEVVDGDEQQFGVFSTGEKLAVALVLDRRDLLAEVNGGYTMLEAVERLGDEWLRAAIAVQKVRR